MTAENDLATPLRRSRRGQPVLNATVLTQSCSNIDATLRTSDPVWTRPARAEDLSESLIDKLSGGELELEDFETRFYDMFERNHTVKSAPTVYGKGKKAANAGSYERYKVGDTVLVETSREPSVAVITAIWRIVGGDNEEYMNVSLHWFLKPRQLASVRARREHFENEIYYSLDGAITVPESMIVSHYTVSRDPKAKDGFRCLSAIDARRGLYYEFEWDEFREKALEVPDFWDCRDQWDIKAEDIIPQTPAKQHVKAYDEQPEDEVEALGTGSRKKNAGIKRKRAMDIASSAKKVRSNLERARLHSSSLPSIAEVHHDAANDNSSGDESDEYIEAKARSDEDSSEDELITAQPSDVESSPDEESDDSLPLPRTPSPRKRGRPPGIPRTPRSPRTPSRKQGRKLAAPTPHSKAALRARASRKKSLAVRPPPPDGAQDLAFLQTLPKDPWLRAMHVLHVASRPDALPCREEEYGRVLRAVEELLDEGSGGCVYIAGVPGTGKTATVHAVVRELKRMAEHDEANPFTYVEINGLRIPEPTAAYGLLWEAISGHDASKEGHLKISSKEALKQLTKYFSSKERAGPGGHACVVLMDELDQLLTTKQDVVYNFFNWPTLAGSKLVVIAVANTMDLPERVMTGRVRSRLGLNSIGFQPYKANQLVEIVQSRLETAKVGLPEDTPGVIAQDGIMFAAKKVSNVSGDARRVLDICRRAVELVQPAKRAARIADVQQVVKEMQNSPTAAYLRELSFHERVMLLALLLCVRKQGVEEIRWGEIKRQHLLLTDQLGEGPDTLRRPTATELGMVLELLAASRAVLYEEGLAVSRKHEDDRRVILNLEHSEVERVLGEEGGTKWRSKL